MMKNKKAIAPLVATVLLIVIVIAAAAIVWGVVIPMIREQIETSCLDTMEMEIDRTWSCFEKSEECLQFKIVRDSKDFELTGIVIRVTDDEGNTETRTLRDGTDMIDCYEDAREVELPGVLEEKVYKMSLEELGFQTGTNLTEIEIAPLIKVGEQEKACDPVHSIPIDLCALP